MLEFLLSQVASVYEKRDLPMLSTEKPATKEAEDHLDFDVDESGFDSRFSSDLSGKFDIKRE